MSQPRTADQNSPAPRSPSNQKKPTTLHVTFDERHQEEDRTRQDHSCCKQEEWHPRRGVLMPSPSPRSPSTRRQRRESMRSATSDLVEVPHHASVTLPSHPDDLDTSAARAKRSLQNVCSSSRSCPFRRHAT